MNQAEAIAHLQGQLRAIKNSFQPSDYERFLNVALAAMNERHPNVIHSSLQLTAGQVHYPLPRTGVLRVVRCLWGSDVVKNAKPWDKLPTFDPPRLRVIVVDDETVLALSEPPTTAMLSYFGQSYEYAYALAWNIERVTSIEKGKWLFFLRAVAEAMLELSLSGVNKSVTMRGGDLVSVTPSNSTPSGIRTVLLKEFAEADLTQDGVYSAVGSSTTTEPTTVSDSTRYRFPVAEPITAGMPVWLNSEGLLFKAAASLERFDVVGVVVLAETTHATYTSDGKVELEDWTTIVGQPLLTPGESYFLQLTPGLLDTTLPADAPVVQVGRAMSGTQLDVEIEITL